MTVRAPTTGRSEAGAALVTAMMAVVLIMALGSALVLLSVTETGISAHHREAARTLYGAEAGLQYASAVVAASSDWALLLAGATDSGFNDGPPAGVRRLAGTTVDLDARTSLLRCGRPRGCGGGVDTSDPASQADAAAWRLFAWGPLGRLVAEEDGDIYVVVWIAGDREGVKGRALTDEPVLDRADDELIRLQAQAFGPMGARRAVEATIIREVTAPTGESQAADGAIAHVTRMVCWREVR